MALKCLYFSTVVTFCQFNKLPKELATKNVESVFSGGVKHWKHLELHRQVRGLVHGFSCYMKSSVIGYRKD